MYVKSTEKIVRGLVDMYITLVFVRSFPFWYVCGVVMYITTIFVMYITCTEKRGEIELWA